MKKTIQKFFISLMAIVALSTSLNAKTIYYVKPNGTGDGSSWEKAGDIHGIPIVNEIWVAKGTYYTTTKTDKTISFVFQRDSIYGGFAGTETSKDERELADLDNNGKIEPWEFVNETILSGDIDGIPDVWTKTMSADGKTWTWTITGNAGNSYNVIKDTYGSVVDGFTISGGNSISYGSNLLGLGGGIYDGSTTSFLNCKVKNCYADVQGGGIQINASSNKVIISNCMVSECASAKDGGGICVNSTGTNTKILNCKVYNCSAGQYGGGICAQSMSANKSYLTTENCLVQGCSSKSNGGGLYLSAINYTSVNTTNQCTVLDCVSAKEGGGIYMIADSRATASNALCLVNNCYISNCEGIVQGGGISAFNNFATCAVTNSTITNCTSGAGAAYGGGIYNLSSTVVNCVVNNCLGNGIISKTNTTIKASTSYCSLSNNKKSTGEESNTTGSSMTSNCISPALNIAFEKPTSFVGCATTDAQRLELKNANWHLLTSSPCINTGKVVADSIQNGKDLDGKMRMLYGTIDIGAYEYIIPKISMPINENFDSIVSFNNSKMFYNFLFSTRWVIENKKASFLGYPTVTNAYSEPMFTYLIDASKTDKVFLNFDMYFESSTVAPTVLGTEKLDVEYSTDFITWSNLATYSNQNGSIANNTYLLDISSNVKGKLVYIRFNANGAQYNRIGKWEIDNISIDSNAPSAVAITKEDKLTYKISNGYLTILNTSEGSSTQLYDINGKLIVKQNCNANSINMNLPRKGVYIVKVKTEKDIKSTKVIW